MHLVIARDKGPGYDGKLTPNPFTHVDVLGLVAGVLTSWGWIRQIRIDAVELRGGRGGLVAVVAISLVATVVVFRSPDPAPASAALSGGGSGASGAAPSSSWVSSSPI